MPATIQILAEKVNEAVGTEWSLAHRALRDYVHRLSDAAFEAQIARVTDRAIFGVLWSVGLSYERQDITMERSRELKG